MKLLILATFALAVSCLPGCNPVVEENGLSTGTNRVAESNLQVGVAYWKRGEYEKSLDKLNKALAADPNYPPTLNALGLLHQSLGRNDKADEYFKKAASINPNDAHTLNNYGLFLCSTNRADEAMDAFARAAKNPLYESPEIPLANAGSCAMDNNRTEEAEEYFRGALDRNPGVPIALIQMSRISYEQGNYLSARGYLQRYLATGKHTSKSLWLGIQIEQQLGDKNTLSSYALLLRNHFPDSKEAQLLRETGLK